MQRGVSDIFVSIELSIHKYSTEKYNIIRKKLACFFGFPTNFDFIKVAEKTFKVNFLKTMFLSITYLCF